MHREPGRRRDRGRRDRRLIVVRDQAAVVVAVRDAVEVGVGKCDRPGNVRRQQAVAIFVDDAAEVPAEATPFDMRGAELSHHGDDCTFETMLERYNLADPVLWDIARIVHEADLADERYDAPEAPGLDVLLRGLSMIRGDEEVLAISRPLFDGLYEYRSRTTLLGREPS